MEVYDILENSKKLIGSFLNKNPDWVVIIRGATATWKSSLALYLSKFFDTEIIWADSRQIYKYMDIWTDKVSLESRNKVKHHQIDIVSPDQTYTAWNRKDDTRTIVHQIQKNKKVPFVVWWTGLYINTLYKNFSIPEVEPDYKLRKFYEKEEEKDPWILYKKLLEFDPKEAQKLHPNSIRHIIRALEIYKKTWNLKSQIAIENPVEQPLLMLWLRREKEDTNQRINKRIKEMFKEGLVKEVKNLLDMWYSPNLPSMQGIGYKEIVGYLKWEYDLERAEELLKRNTHRFWKKQRSWFRKYIHEWNVELKKNVFYKVYYL